MNNNDAHTYNSNTRASNATYNNNQSVHGSLLSDQVYNKHGTTGGKTPYSNNNNYEDNQKWDEAKIYQTRDSSSVELRKYKRFNDLKLLNEQMINLGNIIQSENSPLEILSQGQKGEIKNLLMRRISKISFVPAIFYFLLVAIIVLTDYLLLTIIALGVYIFIIGRTFYYPAKLYYENVQFNTSPHAELFFEEMDFWFKMSVINTLVSLIILTIISIVGIFFEDSFINIIISISKSVTNPQIKEYLENYLTTINFSMSLFLAVLLNIAIILIYFKFINNEKTRNEALRKERSKNIRNQTKSRVQQIQDEINEII